MYSLDHPASRDSVFICGGQPSITYVDRSELDIERHLARAIALPNQIVSLAGTTKSGKTVLCRKVLGSRPYVWVEGGQFKDVKEVWERICRELNFPLEISDAEKEETKGEVTGGVKLILSGSGSQLLGSEKRRTYKIDSMASALRHLLENRVVLVVDDFHYPSVDAQKEFLRNVKGSVFSGLKVILLSVSHRAFDTTKLESELTGRFSAIVVPEWSKNDLKKIAQKGFPALNINCPTGLVDTLADESQNSPFLMQKFCWEICYDLNIDLKPTETVNLSVNFDLKSMFVRIAHEYGMPTYHKLVAGPQSRKIRMRRALAAGGDVDIYEATLRAIAETGPDAVLSYEDIREHLNRLLIDQVPQKHEVTSALKQLSEISKSMGADQGIDWDEDKRQVNISDPYLRFFLRWQIRETNGGGLFSNSPERSSQS